MWYGSGVASGKDYLYTGRIPTESGVVTDRPSSTLDSRDQPDQPNLPNHNNIYTGCTNMVGAVANRLGSIKSHVHPQVHLGWLPLPAALPCFAFPTRALFF